MYAISNAFLNMIEVVQTDRLDHGPVEIAFVDDPQPSNGGSIESRYALNMWNMSYSGGHLRPGEIFDSVMRRVPGIKKRRNPNIFLAPKLPNGFTELHAMLASVLPEECLVEAGLPRLRANFSLSLVGRYDIDSSYARRIEAAFTKYMWTKLCPGTRARREFFGKSAPLKLLADDVGFWMQRIYRVALEWRETYFDEVEDEPGWKSMDDLEQEFRKMNPANNNDNYVLRRPLYTGDIWDVDNAAEREAVIDAAIDGSNVERSLCPVIELLRTHRTHEDFSHRHSWIKEDFERHFYSKRAKLKVELIETIDDAPVWDSDGCDGYSEVMFRDVIAALDLSERKLLLAIRSGKTVCELSDEAGLRSHASVSRRLARLKQKIAALVE